MHGEYDPVMEDALPPPSTLDTPPHDPEPGIRQDVRAVEFELDLVDRQTPDAPARQMDRPTPRADRAEDLLGRRGTKPVSGSLGLPGILEWNDDGAWDDAYGLDVVESF